VHPGADILAGRQQVDESQPLQCALGQLAGAEGQPRWRDPAVASISSRNALMLQAQAQGVISAETAREYLGLSPEQIAREDRTDQRGRAEIGA